MILDIEDEPTRRGELTQAQRRGLTTVLAGIALLFFFSTYLFPELAIDIRMHSTYLVTGPGILNLLLVPLWAWYAFAKRLTRRRWLAYAHVGCTLVLLAALWWLLVEGNTEVRGNAGVDIVAARVKGGLLCIGGLAVTQILLIVQALASRRSR